MKNAVPEGDVAARIAAQTLAKRGADYAGEVRRLLDAALEVIGEKGTTGRARVADIVAAAGLSNEAFYRHFPSKDALVAALVQDGSDRLASYAAHQMSKETTPEGQVRRWVEAVLSQASDQVAATTMAVLSNGAGERSHLDRDLPDASTSLAALLQGPFAALGSPDPDLDSSLVAHATVGKLRDYLWSGRRPARREVDEIVGFCIRTATCRGGPA